MKNSSLPAVAVALAALVYGFAAGSSWSSHETASEVHGLRDDVQILAIELHDLRMEMKFMRIEEGLDRINYQLSSMNEVLEGAFEGIHGHLEERAAKCTPADLDIENLQLMCAELDELGYIPGC